MSKETLSAAVLYERLRRFLVQVVNEYPDPDVELLALNMSVGVDGFARDRALPEIFAEYIKRPMLLREAFSEVVSFLENQFDFLGENDIGMKLLRNLREDANGFARHGLLESWLSRDLSDS